MQDRRTQIIYAGIKVFALNGFERGKIADIAREAGIGKGTVYEYFHSKEELFLAIESAVFGDMSQSLDLTIASNLSPTKKLLSIMTIGTKQIVKMEDALLIIIELWAQSVRGQWHGHESSNLLEIYNQFNKSIKIILQEGIDLGEFRKMSKDGIATLLIAFMDGLAWQYMLLKDKKRFTKIKKEAVRSFIRGIKK